VPEEIGRRDVKTRRTALNYSIALDDKRTVSSEGRFRFTLGNSPKGCKIVAGGRQTTGTIQLIVGTLKGCQILRPSGTPSGCDPHHSLTGGLRFATTSGYSLTTLRVVTTAISFLFETARWPTKL